MTARTARVLTLRREALAPLTTTEMAGVAAAADPTLSACYTDACTHPVSFRPGECRTLPLSPCLSLNGCVKTDH